MESSALAPAADGPDSRTKILDVAEALFARRGFSGVGLREVAQGVGLSKSSLFHHFPTKLDLYQQVLARVLDRLDERIAPVLASHAPHEVRLALLVDSLVDALAEHPTTARLALRSLFEEDETTPDGADQPTPFDATLARLVSGFQQLISDGVAAGAFRPVSPGHLTQTLIGATIYHFASAELGEEILGAPIFSAEQVRERKRELKSLLQTGVRL